MRVQDIQGRAAPCQCAMSPLAHVPDALSASGALCNAFFFSSLRRRSPAGSGEGAEASLMPKTDRIPENV